MWSAGIFLERHESAPAARDEWKDRSGRDRAGGEAPDGYSFPEATIGDWDARDGSGKALLGGGIECDRTEMSRVGFEDAYGRGALRQRGGHVVGSAESHHLAGGGGCSLFRRDKKWDPRG